MSARADDASEATPVPDPPRPDRPVDGAAWEGEIRVDGPDTVAEERLLAPLRLRARAVNLGRVLRLVDLSADAEAGRLDEPGRREAEGLAHQVVGSAGTFGSPGASRDAEAVEQYFADRDVSARRRRRDRPRSAGVRATLDRLRAEFGG